MQNIEPRWRMPRIGPAGLVIAGLAVGYLAGISSAPIAQAEVTEEPRREAFKAGSVLNEPVLREIAATLVRIETRMDRIEKTMNPQAAAKQVTVKPSSTKSGPAKRSN